MLARALKVSLLVGTALNLINSGDAAPGDMVEVLITEAMPYDVVGEIVGAEKRVAAAVMPAAVLKNRSTVVTLQ